MVYLLNVQIQPPDEIGTADPLWRPIEIGTGKIYETVSWLVPCIACAVTQFMIVYRQTRWRVPGRRWGFRKFAQLTQGIGRLSGGQAGFKTAKALGVRGMRCSLHCYAATPEHARCARSGFAAIVIEAFLCQCE